MKWLPLLLLLGCDPSPKAPPSVEARRAPLVPPLVAAEDLDPDPDVLHVALTAQQLTADPPSYAYSGQRPGPVLRARVGDTLRVDLHNTLPDPTTIHWHGLQVPFEMDGVAWMRDPVPPGGRFTYTFPLTHAGTFWYHPHFDTEAQVDAGLYGLLIVEDPAEPAVDELLLVFDAEAERVAAIDDLPVGAPGRPAHGHADRSLRWTLNGEAAPARLTTPGGRPVRVRMLNASNAGYLALRWPGLRQIAGDQGLLPAAWTPEQVVLAPGDRAEFEWSPGREGFTVERLPWSLNGGRTWAEPVPMLDVEIEGPADPPAPVAWPFPEGAPSADPPYTDLVYSFHGSDRAGLWLINGERFPDVTIEHLARGSRPVLEVRNISASNHPFHTHGMHFEVLSINGEPPPFKTIEDTIDVGVRQRIRLRLMPETTGDWLAHCHILPHAHDGMIAVIRVE